MKATVTFVALFVALSLGKPVFAASPANGLATCLADNLNGKERKNLARWIFFAMAVHPEIEQYSKVNSDDLAENDVYIGKLITRLMAEDCPQELKEANAVDPQAIQKAFELVGQVAMQELMADPAVSQALTSYVQHADLEEIGRVMTDDEANQVKN